jgi:beta-glucosidase
LTDNFEYFSEDPILAGKMAAAYIEEVQSQGVGRSLKHYAAANNQEFERMATSSNLDERTLHEVYLPALKSPSKRPSPGSVTRRLPTRTCGSALTCSMRRTA